MRYGGSRPPPPPPCGRPRWRVQSSPPRAADVGSMDSPIMIGFGVAARKWWGTSRWMDRGRTLPSMVSIFPTPHDPQDGKNGRTCAGVQTIDTRSGPPLERRCSLRKRIPPRHSSSAVLRSQPSSIRDQYPAVIAPHASMGNNYYKVIRGEA